MPTTVYEMIRAIRSSPPIVYDIVGCGAVVELLHLPVIRYLAEHAGATVRGCFDRNESAAKAMAQKVRATVWGTAPSLTDSGSDNTILALIATPPEFHASTAGSYVRPGRAILVEKPLATSWSEAAALVDAADKGAAAVFVGQLRRYYRSIRIARRFLELGFLGKIRRVHASEGIRYAWRNASAYVVESPFGGVVLDTGAHLLDAVLFLLDIDCDVLSFEVQEVSKSPSHEPAHECAARMTLDTARHGSLALTLRLSRLESIPRCIRVYGEAGTLVVPLDPDAEPSLVSRTGTFRVRHLTGEAYPWPGHSVILATHVDALLNRTTPDQSILHAKRFLSQMRILETLRNSPLACK